LQKELNDLYFTTNEVEQLSINLSDVSELYDLALQEGDDAVISSLHEEFNSMEKKVQDLEILCLFNQEEDMKEAVMEIHAGTGGTEAQWWAQQLLRMYLLWFKQHNFKAELLDTAYGDEAGIKTATVIVSGRLAYGWLRTECGVHRLSRVSEFDASGRRHTSFAGVFVYPYVADEIIININKSDLEWETFKATGPGGQHINTTDSAVRLKHKPSGIVISCQNERSQRQNKESALRLLHSKLYDAEKKSRQQNQDEKYKQFGKISWGNQIRSYILNPYEMIKDHRTGEEFHNATAILNGDLDYIIRQYLISIKKGG